MRSHYSKKTPSRGNQETPQGTNNEPTFVNTAIQPSGIIMYPIQQQTMVHPGMQQAPIQQPVGMVQISMPQPGMQQTQQILMQNLQLQHPSNQLVYQSNDTPVVNTATQPEGKLMNPIQQQNVIHAGEQQQQPHSNLQMMQQTPIEQRVQVVTNIPQPIKPVSFQYFDTDLNMK